MAGSSRILMVCLLACLFGSHCSRTPEDIADDEASIAPREALNREPLLPAASYPSLSNAKVELGHQLFHDPYLSSERRQISCATCHPLDQGGTLGTYPENDGNEQYDIPTVFNAAHNFSFFWNGRAQRLEGVIQSSIRSESVMDASWPQVLERLEKSGAYGERFQEIYPEWGLSEAAVEDALVAFIQSLTTTNATFDRWLNGEALSEQAQAGYALFKDYGCVRCHQGAGVGGNMFASFEGYITQKDIVQTSDYGRFNVTSNEAHRYQFKVPSLRNVAVTAPYFHDGSAEDLPDAVEAMALYQLGRDLTSTEVDQLVAFLESLTGWYDQRLLSSPGEAPADVDSTPTETPPLAADEETAE